MALRLRTGCGYASVGNTLRDGCDDGGRRRRTTGASAGAGVDPRARCSGIPAQRSWRYTYLCSLFASNGPALAPQRDKG